MNRPAFAVLFCLCLFSTRPVDAYDYTCHRLVNQLAIESLPSDFPEFVKEPRVQERIAYLAGDPDRWRNVNEPALVHHNVPDHFFNVDALPLFDLTPTSVAPLRYEFIEQMARARAAHPERFVSLGGAMKSDRTGEAVGFAPWAITENYAKLKSIFSYLKAYEAAGSGDEITNAREDAIYTMGLMGHYVGDTSQPMHVSKHYSAWTGENPSGFTTNISFHGWIDGGFLEKAGLPTIKEMKPQLHPASMLWQEAGRGAKSPLFPRVMQYVIDQNKQVLPLYELEKAGKMTGDPEKSKEGRTFMIGQLVASGQMLGDLWYTAWKEAPIDLQLRSQLSRRK